MSSRVEHWLPAIDPANGALILPLWAAAVIAALLVAFGLFLLGRVGRDGIVETLSRRGMLLVGAAAAWIVFYAASGDGFALQRQALDARLLEITTRAITPGSPLACLDGTAGGTVEASCEKALFATPETAAAAVAYVAAQLSLLADASDFARRSGRSYESALAGLRLAVETDRFGMVAHVLAVRDGCTSDQCGLLALLRNADQVSDNLVGHRYEFLIARHSAGWPATTTPVAANAPAPATSLAPAPLAKTAPNNLFFPSSASIPAVSIMAAEPGGPPQAKPPADAAAKLPPAPTRKPAPPTQQVRRPTTPTAPTQLAPASAPAPAPAPGQAGGD